MKYTLVALSLFVCLFAFAQDSKSLASSQMPSVITVPAAAQPSAHFDPEAATEAYLAQIPAPARARSDAYFEGGYWLLLWDFLYGAVVSLLLLNFRWSARIRDLAERMTKVRPLQTLIYWIEYLVLTSLLTFPLGWYEGFFREHKYGMATQTLGPWLGDQAKGLLVGAIFGGVLVTLLFAIVRWLDRTWWIWGAVVTSLFLIFGAMIAPVFVLPLFNKVTPLHDPKVTAPVLRLAHASGIQTNDVYEMDASRQTTRMSANVSGFGKTMRITMNDNLLRRGSPEEIQAVMGHEIGHYVLDHVYWGIFFFVVIITVGFALLRWSLESTLARWGSRWDIRGITDPAVLPLVTLLASIFFFVLTPVINSVGRTQEHQADMYGINSSRQPDGFAQAAIHLGEYRKMSPGPVEEWIFFDHPSGRHRIHDAMVWKGQNLMLYPVGTEGSPAIPH
jgi:Zn-dependent protease with chaperone function